MTRRTTRAALTVVGSLLTALVVAPPAQALITSAAPDTFRVYTGAEYRLDPIANDTYIGGPRPTLCGLDLTSVDAGSVYVEQEGDLLYVEASPGATGPVELGYEICQGAQRAAGEVRINLRSLRDVAGAVKPRTRSRVLFSNRNTVDVTVQWGDVTSGRPDGHRVVPAGSTITVRVTRRQIYWLGYLRDGETVVTVGDGVIRKIPQPRR